MERLDKFLVAGGVGSRSQVKDILKKGTVTVDGVPERDGARKIDPDKQMVCLNGRRIGVTANSYQEGLLTAWLQESGYRCTVVEYMTWNPCSRTSS